jgi:hypothetical protein
MSDTSRISASDSASNSASRGFHEAEISRIVETSLERHLASIIANRF